MPRYFGQIGRLSSGTARHNTVKSMCSNFFSLEKNEARGQKMHQEKNFPFFTSGRHILGGTQNTLETILFAGKGGHDDLLARWRGHHRGQGEVDSIEVDPEVQGEAQRLVDAGLGHLHVGANVVKQARIKEIGVLPGGCSLPPPHRAGQPPVPRSGWDCPELPPRRVQRARLRHQQPVDRRGQT